MTRPVEFLKSVSAPGGFPAPDLPEVAVVGRSNVGKSSLLNCLTGVRKLAFVSKTPGRTQMINFFRVGSEFLLVDLPGYGFAKVPAKVQRDWERLVTSYLFEREALRLVLLLVDARREPMDNDLAVRNLLAERDIPFRVVATKTDKLSKSQLARQRGVLKRTYAAEGGLPIVAFSAVTSEGRKELWKVIERHVREERPARKS